MLMAGLGLASDQGAGLGGCSHEEQGEEAEEEVEAGEEGQGKEDRGGPPSISGDGRDAADAQRGVGGDAQRRGRSKR